MAGALGERSGRDHAVGGGEAGDVVEHHALVCVQGVDVDIAAQPHQRQLGTDLLDRDVAAGGEIEHGGRRGLVAQFEASGEEVHQSG